MKRSRNMALMTTIALGAVLFAADAASAGGCGRRGGGGYGGGGHYRPSFSHGHHYHSPRPSYPAYQPSYPPSYSALQPNYQPGYPQQQPIPSAPQSFSQPTTGGPQFAGIPQTGPQTTPQPGGNVAQQLQPQQQPTNNTQPPAFSQTPPGDGNASNSGSATNSAESSALQALGGFAPPATVQASSPQQASYVGTWSASLTNGARVQLNLQSDGSFRWAATNKSGRTSSFQGTYTVGGGSLTLIRSQDNQQLAGNMNINGSNAFEFKLNGTSNAAALSFTRS